MASGSITLGGTAKITGNVKPIDNPFGLSLPGAATESPSNLYLPSEMTFALGTGDHAPAKGMEVRITKDGTDPVISESYANTLDHSVYFFSDGGAAADNVYAGAGLHKLAFGTFAISAAGADGSYTLSMEPDDGSCILLARFDDNGRFLGITRTALTGGSKSGTAAVPAGQGGKLVFYWVNTALRPLASAVICNG